MQGRFVNLCYTMENHAITTMMTYFGSTDHGLGTEVDRGQGGTSSRNRLESPLIYIYMHTHAYTHRRKKNFYRIDILMNTYTYMCIYIYIYIYIYRIWY